VPLAAGGALPPVAAAAPHVGAGHLPPAAAGAALPAAVWLFQPLHVPADVPSGPEHKNTVWPQNTSDRQIGYNIVTE
jgi:hypothetical protein